MIKKLIISTFTLLTFWGSSINAQKNNPLLKDTIKDRSIVVPPQMERNYDALYAEWSKYIRPSSKCDKMSDEDITYPDSVYINRLHSLPSEMELVYNQIVRSYIDMYSGRRRNQVGYMLAEGEYYFPIFEHMLDKYGLPLELKYLPVIESALKPTAVSPMGATGLWQFMLGTGKMYDLEINSLVDERRDPLKASDAAVRYLKDLYSIYGDWNLVIAAYNCGPGNVNKAIRRSNGQTDYWAIYPYLPRETRGYVPAFIAATYIMSYYKEHNICPMEFSYPPSMDTIAVNKTIHFQQISDVLGISMEDIRSLNPQYKKDIVPGDYKEYIISLPSVKIADFITKQDSILAYRTEELLAHRKTVDMDLQTSTSNVVSTSKVIHKVRKGESLNTIAKRYDVTASQIKKWNKLRTNRLTAGTRLTINKPVYAKVSSKNKTEQLAQNSTKKENSKVDEPTEGDSEDENVDIESTSESSNVIADYLKKQIEGVTFENDSTNEVVSKANRINRADVTQSIYHKVRIGETLTQIANRYEVTKAEIMKWNKLSSNAIKVGQRLIIYIPEKKNNSTTKTTLPNKVSDKAESTVTKKEKTATKKTEPAAKTLKEKPVAASPTSVKKAESAKKETAKKETTKKEATQKEAAKKGSTKKETVTKKESTKKAATYTVRKGDNLYRIASDYKGVSADDIKKANGLTSEKLSIGQKLVIPKAKGK